MKKIFVYILILLSMATTLFAKAEPKLEVVFVPGWFSENRESSYKTHLSKIYPDAKITVLSWKSNEKKWNVAVSRAEAFSSDVMKYLTEKSPEERDNTILIGHSLGGRILIKTAEKLADQKMKVKQFILLGTAADHDVDLTPIISASTDRNINVFSYNDSVLKFLFTYSKKNVSPALGYCGTNQKLPERFVQYKMTTSERENSSTDRTTAIKEFLNHICPVYFDELEQILKGKKQPYTPEYDYSEVKIEKTFLSLPKNIIHVPVVNIIVLDSYAGWTLCQIPLPKEKKVYCIIDHLGRIRQWNCNLRPLRRSFSTIKSQIRKIEY